MTDTGTTMTLVGVELQTQVDTRAFYADLEEEGVPFGSRELTANGRLAYSAKILAVHEDHEGDRVTVPVGEAGFSAYRAYPTPGRHRHVYDIMDEFDQAAADVGGAIVSYCSAEDRDVPFDVLLVDRIFIDPAHRGKKFGHLALHAILANFAPGVGGLAVLHAWGTEDDVPADRKGHQKGLTDYWMSSGCFEVERDHVLFWDTDNNPPWFNAHKTETAA